MKPTTKKAIEGGAVGVAGGAALWYLLCKVFHVLKECPTCSSSTACQGGQVPCNGKCCPPVASCQKGQCVCPSGAGPCGNLCCPSGQTCQNGECVSGGGYGGCECSASCPNGYCTDSCYLCSQGECSFLDAYPLTLGGSFVLGGYSNGGYCLSVSLSHGTPGATFELVFASDPIAGGGFYTNRMSGVFDQNGNGKIRVKMAPSPDGPLPYCVSAIDMSAQTMAPPMHVTIPGVLPGQQCTPDPRTGNVGCQTCLPEGNCGAVACPCTNPNCGECNPATINTDPNCTENTLGNCVCETAACDCPTTSPQSGGERWNIFGV